MKGGFTKSWAVECLLCDHKLDQLGELGSVPDAAADARRAGWAQRQGMWICAACVPTHPPGTKVIFDV